MATATLNINALKKKRTPIRTLVTKTIKDAQAALDDERFDDYDVKLQILKIKGDELRCLDILITDALATDDDISDTVMEDECTTSARYQEEILACFALNRPSSRRTSTKEESEQDNNTSEIKFPKLELLKFNGELREWLGWWAQFQKIHESQKPASDKFQYLIQATEGTARELVSGFPASKDNYGKAIQALKERFGNTDILSELYTRDLIRLCYSSSKQTLIQPIYDKIVTALRSLESLKIDMIGCAPILTPLVESTIPDETLRTFRRMLPISRQTSRERLSALLVFLKSEIETEQRVALAKGFTEDAVPSTSQTPTSYFLHAQSSTITCTLCGMQGHRGADCRKTARMPIEEKKAILLRKGACFVCTELKHRASECSANVSCRRCQKRHVTTMCPQQSDRPAPQDPNIGQENDQSPHAPRAQQLQQDSLNVANTVATTTVSELMGPEPGHSYLPTILFKVKGRWGQIRQVSALCDTGAQRSFILKSVATKLGLPVMSTETIRHQVFGASHYTEEVVSGYIVHAFHDNFHCDIEVLGTDTITSYAPITAALDDISDVISLQKPSGPVEILLGADILASLLTGRKKYLTNSLVALETELGWAIMGRSDKTMIKSTNYTHVVHVPQSTDMIDQFWALEVLGIRDRAYQLKQEQQNNELLNRFHASTIFAEGRYTVALPWKSEEFRPRSNKDIALRRLHCVTRRMSPDLYVQYDAIFQEWLRHGIIERALDNETGHYLPHRPVIRDHSFSTRIRPVFDASAKLKSCPSLNDTLEEGINYIENILDILYRFREKRVGVIADISKAFLQIGILDSDRDYLKFLWWDADGQLIVLRHARLVFGLKPSPYILGAVVRSHLQKYPPSPTVTIMQESFYVDDLVSSLERVEDLDPFIKDASQIMADASMALTKWNFSGQVQGEPTSVLGLRWNTATDTLSLNLSWWEPPQDGALTKRFVLSAAQKTFDPIGLISPVTLVPRLLLQSLWTKKLDWDTPLNQEDAQDFLKWVEELPTTAGINIPRWLGVSGSGTLSLHVFCDASKLAYASVIFLRVENTMVTLHFLQAKARVAPTKNVTIPRLELMAVLIGIRLVHGILQAHNWKIPFTVWTDSTTVIQWVKRSADWTTFVYNRVTEIRTVLGQNEIRHVPGGLNPADIASRGCFPKKFLDIAWWEGPQWLKEDPQTWPTSSLVCDQNEVCQELKKSAVVLNVSSASSEWYVHISSFKKILKIIAWLKRFCSNAWECVLIRRKLKSLSENGLNPTDEAITNARLNAQAQAERAIVLDSFLSVNEIVAAEYTLYKMAQKEFGVEKMRLNKLNVVIDNGLMKVKTRLVLREDSDTFKYPCLLPGKHILVRQLIEEEHRKAHEGFQTLQNRLREKLWILGSRRVIKAVVRSCMICRRHHSRPFIRPEPPLPVSRIRDAAPFEITCVDFAGPLLLSTGENVWICLFTCAVVRAVHLELCLELTTTCFIQAFRRFTARRGRCQIVYSDNGTNFVGANNILNAEMTNFVQSERIQWRFSAPAAPWWGGWWERLVGLTKLSLRKVLGKASLTFTELSTVLCEIEAIVNSRPLCASTDASPDNLTFLTPSLFLRELPGEGIPQLDDGNTFLSLNKRERHLREVRDNLRQRFRIEYLAFLKAPRPAKESGDIRVGDLILIGSDLKRQQWPLARVIELFPGRDGVVRSARLRTANGELTRPVQVLYPLEVSTLSRNPQVVDSEPLPNSSLQDGSEIPLSGDAEMSELKTEAPAVMTSDVPSRTTRSGRIVQLPSRFR